MVYIIAQIIGFLAFIVSLIAYHRKKKSKILSNMVLCIKTDNCCVELYNHEIDEFEDVCNNIEDFLQA